jgi:hypothetical protein
MYLILYGKEGCHLCEGLEEKLRQITDLPLELEIRDIATNDDWWAQYQYEVPVLYWQVDGVAKLLPRSSPRASVGQVQQMLQKYLDNL